MSYSIGCDVSKNKLDIAIMNEHHEVQTTFVVSNNTKGFQTLCEKLIPYREGHIILEATSHYHLGACFALVRAGYDVYVINPLIMKRYAISGIRKTQTDAVDAKLLSLIGLLEPSLQPWSENQKTLECKRLSQLIYKFNKQRRSCVQRLHQLQEMEDTCDVDMETERTALQMIMKTIMDQTKILEKRLGSFLKEETEILSSIPGVGKASAMKIVAELGDISRFSDRNSVTAFSGLDPSKKESGTSIHGKGRITKRGSQILRCILGQTAWGVMMHNAVFKKYAEKKRAEGKHYFSILVIVAKKLLQLMYTLLKNKQRYDFNYHLQHAPADLTAV